MENIEHRIVSFCAENSMTKTDLAKILGVGNQAVYSWCAGRRAMDSKTYKKFCSLERHSGFLDPGFEITMEGACKRLGYFSRERPRVEKWTSNLVDVAKNSSESYHLKKIRMDQFTLDDMTNFISSLFDDKTTLQVIKKLTNNLEEKLEQDSLTDEEFIKLFIKKWEHTPLSLSFLKKENILIVTYSVPLKKSISKKLKKDLLANGSKIEDLEEEDMMKMLSKQYSFEACFFPNHTFNLSSGSQLKDDVFQDSWALSMDNTRKWRNLLRTMGRREALQKTFEEAYIMDTFLTLDFLMKSPDIDSVYAIEPPEELKCLLKKKNPKK